MQVALAPDAPADTEINGVVTDMAVGVEDRLAQ
jgi:hypothetical protein